MAYATADDVAAGFRTLTADETEKAAVLCLEAAVLIDSTATKADEDVRKLVTCRMIRRALGSGSSQSVPYGATQGSLTAGPYSQQWTYGSGSSGELYLSSQEKKLLGLSNRAGFTASCLEE